MMRVLFCCMLLAAGMPAALAAEPQADWIAQKCRAYDVAWAQAVETFGTDEMNYAFIAGNENFIAGGCTETTDICPRSAGELEVANALTLALMNAGTASTFLPFRCPPAEPDASAWTGPGL